MMIKIRYTLFIILLAVSCATDSGSEPVVVSPGLAEPVNLAAGWQEASPASQGVNNLNDAVAMAAAHPRLKSFLVVRNGKLIAEHYFDGDDQHTIQDVRSVTKSVVSTLVGIALEAGDINSIDEHIGPYLARLGISLMPAQETITIRHLLTMSAGFQWLENNGNAYLDWIVSGNPVGYLLAQPMEDMPGATFNYNSAGTNLLARVLEGAVSQDIASYAEARLFGPLGISAAQWEYFANQTANGGAGLDLLPRDLAKIGQLYLQEGQSGNSQLIPAQWVANATAPQYSWRSDFGALTKFTYGYQWWVRDGGNGDAAFLAWGHGGQYIYVVPEKELVVVTTTDWRNSAAAGGADALEKEALEVIINGVLPAVN